MLLRPLAAGVRVQLLNLRAAPVDFLLAVVVTPVFFTVAILLLMHVNGRLEHLAAYGVIGPAVVSLWASAIMSSGEIVAGERADGTLELLVATPPGSFELMLLGRILANTLVALLALLETTTVAWLGFGVTLQVSSAPRVLQGLLVLVLSTSAAALLMANLFVLARTVRIFQNALTFPFYLLGGLAFPISALPEWLRPCSSLIALAWGSDLLRSGFGQPAYYPAGWGFWIGLLLALLYLLIGYRLFVHIERRVRQTATLGSF